MTDLVFDFVAAAYLLTILDFMDISVNEVGMPAKIYSWRSLVFGMGVRPLQKYPAIQWLFLSYRPWGDCWNSGSEKEISKRESERVLLFIGISLLKIMRF